MSAVRDDKAGACRRTCLRIFSEESVPFNGRNHLTCSVGSSNHQVATEPPRDEYAGEREYMPGRHRCHALAAPASLTPRALSCSMPWSSGRPFTRTGSATFLNLNVVATDSMLAIARPQPPWVTKAT